MKLLLIVVNCVSNKMVCIAVSQNSLTLAACCLKDSLSTLEIFLLPWKLPCPFVIASHKDTVLLETTKIFYGAQGHTQMFLSRVPQVGNSHSLIHFQVESHLSYLCP